MQLTRYFSLMGFDFTADIEFTITSYPVPARTYGPPENCYPAEPAEYDIESIIIQWDNGEDYPWHEPTGEFFYTLASLFDDTILEAIDNYDPTEWLD